MPSPETLIFIDTCSLLVSCWNIDRNNAVNYNPRKDVLFWGQELPLLSSLGSVILTKRNYEELVKLSSISNDSKRPRLGERCKTVLERLRPRIEEGTVSVVGDPNDPFADAILLSVALKFRTQKNLLFLTQDKALANDLISISQFKSVRPRKNYELKVRRIGLSGAIERWHINSASLNKRSKQRRSAKSETASSCVVEGSNVVEEQSTAQQILQEWWR